MKSLTAHIIFLCVCLTFVDAQSFVDTLQLEEVVIAASKIRKSSLASFEKKWQTNKLEKNTYQNIAELLQQETGIFIKSYGLGSIATSSVRGASASQTAILWNGLPITSPMLGLVDISLLPINFFDKVEVNYGGNSTNWGSGSMGGNILLGSQNEFGQPSDISSRTDLGSFGQFRQGLDLSIGNNRLRSRTKLFYQDSKNNFKYTIGGNTRTHEHAEVFQYGLLQEIHKKLNAANSISAYYWHQKADRNIPATSTQNNSNAHQHDQFNRLTIQSKHLFKKGLIEAKLAYFSESIQFVDSLLLIDDRTSWNTGLAELQWLGKISTNQQVLFGMNTILTTANAAAYEDRKSELRNALFLNYEIRLKSISLRLGIRQALIDNSLAPITPSLGIEYAINSSAYIFARLSRDYRHPTLNDRYWRPGGNDQLKPEKGWSQELGIKVFNNKNIPLQWTSTAFNRSIDNWILWGIQSGDFFFSANNLTRVWSRGIQQELKWNHEVNSIVFNHSLSYDFTLSTNQISLASPNIDEGAQLIYTPKHKALISSKIEINTWSININHQYTSPTRGINDEISAYYLLNGSIRNNWTFNRYQIDLSLHINNLLNKRYRIIERRPMPGRNIVLSLIFKFNSTNN